MSVVPTPAAKWQDCSEGPHAITLKSLGSLFSCEGIGRTQSDTNKHQEVAVGASQNISGETSILLLRAKKQQRLCVRVRHQEN